MNDDRFFDKANAAADIAERLLSGAGAAPDHVPVRRPSRRAAGSGR